MWYRPANSQLRHSLVVHPLLKIYQFYYLSILNSVDNLLDLVTCKSYDSFYKNTTRICGITMADLKKKTCTTIIEKIWIYNKPQ